MPLRSMNLKMYEKKFPPDKTWDVYKTSKALQECTPEL